MVTDPLMTGYVPLIATAYGVFQPKDYSERIRGVVPGKTEQEISLYPEIPLNFGTETNGQTSSQFQVLIINRGYKAVTIDSIEIVGDFTRVLPTNLTIQPGDVLAVSVSFAPKRTGDHTGGLYVTAGNASGERFLKLVGTGA